MSSLHHFRHLKLPLRRCVVDGCGEISNSYTQGQINRHINTCHPELRNREYSAFIDNRVGLYLEELLNYEQHCFGTTGKQD